MIEFNRYFTRLERELKLKKIADARADFLKAVLFISICGGLMWFFGIGL